MTLFTVDVEKCKKDGICAAECPIGAIINFDDKDKVPEPFPEMEYLCLDCGHCVTVCPQAALTHKNLSPDACDPVISEMALDPKQAEHFLRSRRSIRKYKKKEVEKTKLEEIIKIASHAPSGHNMQPVNWHVIHGRKKLKEVTVLVIEWMESMIQDHPDLAEMLCLNDLVGEWNKGIDLVCRDAPAIILSNGAENSFSDNACKIAMTYLDLAIPSFGLGSQWNGFFQMAASEYQPLREALGFHENYTCYAALLVGYPKYKYFRMPPRNEPKTTWAE